MSDSIDNTQISTNVNADEIMASVASSYCIDYTSFDDSLTSLLKRASDDLAIPVPRAGGTIKPYWGQCAQKLLIAYERAKANPSAFKQMFANFYDSNASELSKPLFADDESSVVSDQFFKDTEVKPAPKSDGREKSVRTSLGSHDLHGPVVYFRMDAPHLASACVPIGEIYTHAIRAHIDADESNIRRKLFPTLTLLDFYSVIYHSLPESHPDRDKVARNVEDLCEAAEAVGPGTGPGAQKNDMGGMDNVFETIAGMMNAFGGTNPNMGQMSDAIRGVGGVVKNLVDRLTEGSTPIGRNADGSIDPAAIVGRLGDVFQSPDVQRQIAETAKTASTALNKMGIGSSNTSTDNSSTE